MASRVFLAALLAFSMASCSEPPAPIPTPTGTPTPTAVPTATPRPTATPTPTVRPTTTPISLRRYPDLTVMPNYYGQLAYFSRAVDNTTGSDMILFAIINQGNKAAEFITIEVIVNYYGEPLYLAGTQDRIEAKQPRLFYFLISEAIKVPKPPEIEFLDDRVEVWISIDPHQLIYEGPTGDNNNHTGKTTLYVTPPLSSNTD